MPEARARLATWLIFFVVILGFLCVLYSIHMRNLQNQLIFQTQQQMDLWEELTKSADFLLRGNETSERPDRITRQIQNRLNTLHAEELAVQDSYRRALESSSVKFWLALSGISIDQLTLQVTDGVREHVTTLVNAEPYLIRAGYSTWAIGDAVHFLSGAATEPLEERRNHLLALTRRADLFVWSVILGVLTIITISIVVISLTVLKPALRSLRASYVAELKNSQRLDRLSREVSEKARDMKTVLDNMPAMIVRLDSNGRLLAANEPYLQNFGISDAPDAMGKHVSDIVGQANFKLIEPKIKQALSGRPVQFEIALGGENGLRRCQANYIPGRRSEDTGEVVDFFAMVVDVEEQAKAIQQLRESEEKYRATLNSIGDTVLSIDTRGVITYVNPAGLRMLGVGLSDVVGTPIQSVLMVSNRGNDSPVEQPVDQVLTRGESISRLDGVELKIRDRQPIIVTFVAAPIRSFPGKELAGVVWSIRDISTEYELREQLLQSEKLKTVGQLASGITHDFNNIFAGMMNSIEVILHQKNPPLPENVVKSLELMVLSIKRARNLSERLFVSVQGTRADFAPVDLKQVVEDIAMICRQTMDRKIDVSTRDTSDYSIVLGDQGALENALLNLCINASDAMPTGGELELSLRNTTDDMLLDDADESRLKIHLSVSDTGTGIDPEIADSIFEPFVSTKNPGTGRGLGLASVNRCLSDHGAIVNVDTEPGRGTSFELIFPAHKSAALPVSSRLKFDMKEPSGLVLVIDDEELLLQSTTALLEIVGMKVLSAKDAVKGLEIFEEKYREIDCVLLDINMPVINGSEALDRMKQIDPDVNVVIVTGYAESDQIDNIVANGARQILRKPYGINELKEALALIGA